MRGADSAARFSAQAAKAAGFDIGARYINQSFTGLELADYQAHGLTFLPIYEESGKPGSFADGARQGTNAIGILRRLGLGNYGCAFTDDVSGAGYATVREWVRGIRSTFPNHIVYYGPNFIGDQLVDEGLADSVWIEGAFSYSRPYPNGGKPPTARHACGIQYPTQVNVGGVTVDVNDFYSTPWLPGASKPSTPSTPAQPEEDDVTLEELQQELQNQDTRIRLYIDAKFDELRSSDKHPNLGDVINELRGNKTAP